MNKVNRYGSEIPIYVHVVGHGIIARGILRQYFEAGENELYWPDEIESKKIIYRYRLELVLTHVACCESIEEILSKCLQKQDCKELVDCTIRIKELQDHCDVGKQIPTGANISWIDESFNVDCIDSYIQQVLNPLKPLSKTYEPCSLKLPKVGELRNNPIVSINIYDKALNRILHLYRDKKTSFTKDDLNSILYNILLEYGVLDKNTAYEEFIEKKHHMLAPFYNDLRRLCILEIGVPNNWSSKEKAEPAAILKRLDSIISNAIDLGLDFSINTFLLTILLCTAYGRECGEEACVCRSLYEKDPRKVLGRIFEPVVDELREKSGSFFTILPLNPVIYRGMKKVMGG